MQKTKFTLASAALLSTLVAGGTNIAFAEEAGATQPSSTAVQPQPAGTENAGATATTGDTTGQPAGGTAVTPAPAEEKPEAVAPAVAEKPEYTEPIATNTPVDENGELILPPVLDVQPYGAAEVAPAVEEKPEAKLVDFETVYEGDETMDFGTEKVKQEGVPGVLDPDGKGLLAEPVKKIVVKGTKPKVEGTSPIEIVTQEQEDATLEKGKTEVVQEGEEGVRENIIKYTVDPKTGEVKEEKDTRVVKVMKVRIVKVGTKAVAGETNDNTAGAPAATNKAGKLPKTSGAIVASVVAGITSLVGGAFAFKKKQ